MFRSAWVLIAVCVGLDLFATSVFNAAAGNLPPQAGAKMSFARESSSPLFAHERFDAAIVFCAGIGPYHGLDQTTVERLRFAAELYHEGRVAAVVGIGGHWRANREADERGGMSETLREAGVPAHAIFQDHESYDTRTNLDELFRLSGEHKWRKVALITSPLHMQRVLYLIQTRVAAGPAVDSRLEFTASPYLARAQATLFAAWRETHHEWIAWAMIVLLPEDIFRDLMRWRRL